jgi:RNA polymerase sigma-70 factor (ECF subfamily)
MSSHVEDLSVPDGKESVEEAVIRTDELRSLYRCIDRLSFLDKTLVSLYLEDLSYREIADVVGISKGNVGVRLHRIKKTLNRCLEARQ